MGTGSRTLRADLVSLPLALVLIGAASAMGLHRVVPVVPPLFTALAVGLAVGRLLPSAALERTTCWASRTLLRAGVVLLGLQLAIGDVLRIGVRGLVLVILVVACTFAGVLWVGRRLGVSPGLSLLIATGFAICGASAVAAMEGVADAEKEEVAYTITLVTLCGTVAMLVLPVLWVVLGLDAARFGAWTGASVHDVAQVVGTAAVAGPVALQAAVVVKLARILLLAPLVAVVAVRKGHHEAVTLRRMVPAFIVMFLVAIALRSAGLVPDVVVRSAASVQLLLFAAALVALGARTDLSAMRRLSGRPLGVASCAWILVAGISYIGVRWVV